MPTFKVTDPQSGKTFNLTGDSAPTEAELNEIFGSIQQPEPTPQPTPAPQLEQQPVPAQVPAQQVPLAQQEQVPTPTPAQQPLAQPVPAPQESTIGDKILGGLEAAGTVASSIIAQPLAGIAGVASLPFEDLAGSAENVAATQDALTFQPRTEEGKAALEGLGKFIQGGVDLANIPLSGLAGLVELISGQGVDQAKETVAKVKQDGISAVLADRVLEETDSPIAATIAQTIPAFSLELIGLKGLKAARVADPKLSADVAKAITQAAPDIQTIKKATTEAYKALDETGIKIRSQAFDSFADKLAQKLKKEGLDKDLTPKSNAALNRILDSKGTAKAPSELETLRKIASSAAKSIEKPDARLGNMIVKEIDDSLDKISNQIGGEFKNARALAQRGFKSQTITDMIENASHTASGLENGLRIEARKILKNPKKRKGFTKDELAALKEIEQGTTASNTAKFLGKFGISEGQATSMMGASIGIGGGGALGSFFGPAGAAVGAVAVPAIGQIAKNTAQKLTLNSTKFADDLARSGKNSKEVVKAYIKHTPIKDRNISDLTDILLDTDLKPSDIKSLSTSRSATGKIVSDALFFAGEIKRRATQAGSAALIAQPDLTKEGTQ